MAFGPAAESLRLSEHYRQLTDDELIAIAQDTSELTQMAQQALASEISQRKLTIPTPQMPTSPPLPDDQTEHPYDEERQVVQIATVWSLPDALKLQALLDQAEIPFFMGEEKATRAEQVTSNFRSGVSVEVMQVGVPWARQAMQGYEPADEPVTPEDGPDDDVAVHCPKCHSEDVIFEHLAGSADSNREQRFDWTCAACGNQWEDEGVETKY